MTPFPSLRCKCGHMPDTPACELGCPYRERSSDIMPSPKDWKPSDPQNPITVNVDDWLANRSGIPQPKIPAPKVEVTQSQIDQARKERRDLRDFLQQEARRAAQAAQVEKEDRDCSECGENRPH